MAEPSKEESNSAGEYLELLVNAANRVSVWKWVALFEGVIILALLYALVMAVKSMPVRLVPHEFSANNGAYVIKPNGESNAEYLVLIAENDIKLLTDWTPATVGTQYARFLNRCAPELYAQKNIELFNESESLRKTSYSQVFYPQSRKYVGPGRVQIQGTLVRYAGEKIILQVAGVYTIGYRFFNGMPSLIEIQYSKPADAATAQTTPQVPVMPDTPYVDVGTTEPAGVPATGEPSTAGPGTGSGSTAEPAGSLPTPGPAPASAPSAAPAGTGSNPATQVAPDPAALAPAPPVNAPQADAAPAARRRTAMDILMRREATGEAVPAGPRPAGGPATAPAAGGSQPTPPPLPAAAPPPPPRGN